jgi:hypothetical protein
VSQRLALSVLVAAVACATPRAPESAMRSLAPPPAEPTGLLVRMTRDGRCFGACPAYSVEVDVSGRVVYRGGYNVLTVGAGTAHLDRAALAALRRAIETAGFRAVSEDCCGCNDMTDMDSLTLTVADGAAPKTISVYHGCKATPASLIALERSIDRIVGTETWIGSLEDRAACFDWGEAKTRCALGVRTLGPNHCSVLRGVFTQASNDMVPPSPWPGTLVTDAGKVGFLVSSILPDSPYTLCGFENGDVWTEVGGIPLTSADAAAKTFNLLGAAPSLVVDLLRRGQPMSIRVDFR